MLELIANKQKELNTDTPDDQAPLPSTAAAPPGPQPPKKRKKDLYEDAAVFELIDRQAINVAESEQTSYTELIDQLTHGLVTDLEKARAIFRWITVKDLNAIEFGDSLNTDSPLGLLRGIKYGTETYHTLFMRLCSYAGLHCVDVKGHSKSVGYEPGMKIQPGKFTNTWNAVLIDDEWRFVQCNWAARHLVKASAESKTHHEDNIKYQYDEHYFLPDPEQFIYDFLPHDAEWQLLERPVSLEDFESMPFVRSMFFRYGLQFENQRQAVVYTDRQGACEIKFKMPTEVKTKLAFYSSLKVAGTGEAALNGIELDRYVLHTSVDDVVVFDVHVPRHGEYLMEIFANLIENTESGFGQTFRLKCVCKYKIVCEELKSGMVPLPACVNGEWGPLRAQRFFNIVPITHLKPIIETRSPDIEIHFQMPKLLKVYCKLRNNKLSELDKLVSYELYEDLVLVVWISLPEDGQFGFDLFAKNVEGKNDKREMTHCCKYLINYSKNSDAKPAPPPPLGVVCAVLPPVVPVPPPEAIPPAPAPPAVVPKPAFALITAPAPPPPDDAFTDPGPPPPPPLE
jgi:hypothetical protein